MTTADTRTNRLRKAISSVDVLISFLLIIALFAALLLVCFIPVYYYFSSYVTDATINTYQEKLDAGTAQLDNTFSTLSNAIQATVDDPLFRVFRYSNPTASLDPVDLPEMCNTLHNLLFADELVSEAGLLLSSDVVVTRSRTFYGSQYYSLYPTFLSCEDMTEEEWRAAMDASRPLMAERRYTTVDKEFVLSNNYDALTYSAYWTNGYYRTKNVFYALLPSDKLLAMLTDAEIAERGSVEILDSSGNVLLTRAGGEAGDVSYVSTTTKTYGLRITVGVPNSIIHEQMQGFRHIIWLYAAGMIIFALALTLLFASRLAQPLRKLRMAILGSRYISAEYVRNNDDARLLKSYNRQFDQLAQSIDGVERQMAAYESKLSMQRASMRVQMLDKALHRGLQSVEDFQSLFPDFPHRYRLCMLRYELGEDTAIDYATQLQANITAAVHGLLGDIIVHPMDGSALALIIPCGEQSDEIAHIQQLRSRLTEITDQPIGCTISDVFTDPEQLIDAYQQTQFLYAAFADSGMLSVEQMKDLPPQKQLLPLSYTKLNAVYAALYAGNLPALLFTLDECTQEIEEADVTLLRHIYNQLADLIAHVRLENPVLLYDLSVPAFDRGVRLPKDFAPYFETICEKLSIEREDQSLMFSKQIMDYINQNIYDPDLYLASVLAHFDISAPTLQKMVRLATGQTFASYVEEQRLARAHVLVSQTNLSVQEIASNCGFASANTFYKSFRRKYGVSPQDSRKPN